MKSRSLDYRIARAVAMRITDRKAGAAVDLIKRTQHADRRDAQRMTRHPANKQLPLFEHV
jgi:hypothetical protein